MSGEEGDELVSARACEKICLRRGRGEAVFLSYGEVQCLAICPQRFISTGMF